MKLLFVIGSLEVGGAETQMVLLIEQLRKNDIGCEVFSLEGDGPLTERLHKAGVIVHDGGYRSGPGIIWFARQLFKSLYRLTRLLLRDKFQVVHAYLPLANFFSAVAGIICRIPLVITSRRALGTHQERYPIWRYFDSVSNKLSGKITVNSMGVWNDIIARENVSEGKLTLIYNGIDVSPFILASDSRVVMRNKLNCNDDEIVIVMVANLISYKGHSDVIEALSLVTDKCLKILFVGENRGIEKALKQQIKTLKFSTEVHFLGKRQDIPAVLSTADIGLVASHEEGFCNALLEMMASSLPIIATDVGGNPEALKQGELGIIIPSKSPQDIASAIHLLVNDKSLRERFGQKAFEEVSSHYSIDNMLTKHLALYENK